MLFDPTIAAIRFGMGLSPIVTPPASVQDMLTRLAGPDEIAQIVPIAGYDDAYPSRRDFREAGLAVNDARGTDGEAAARASRDQLRADGREAVIHTMRTNLARATHTSDGLRERLALFWADHFTVRATIGTSRNLVSPYIEEAIRPHLAGSFADMLVAVVGHPMMILYLDQHVSVGPNSRDGQRHDRGLNENLARELLELHTLGVDGNYTQGDVRELAELLTGITANPVRGFSFNKRRAEPGAETVLGVTYGGDEESMDHVIAALRDLAMHPDTARHLSHKLAVHFVSAHPDPAMVDAMAARYLATGGNLMAVYEVFLGHDAAWQPGFEKIKQPYEFIASSMRALAVPMDEILTLTMREVRVMVQRPLSVMGQDWQSPLGPDGWTDDATDWITPQGMAGRISWAMQMPEDLLDVLPDPRDFVLTALGPTPPDPVVFAAGAADTVGDGIGLVLASAAFQRR